METKHEDGRNELFPEYWDMTVKILTENFIKVQKILFLQ